MTRCGAPTPALEQQSCPPSESLKTLAHPRAWLQRAWPCIMQCHHRVLRGPARTQVVIAFAEHRMHAADPRYPVGQARMETVGVVSCAVIMTLCVPALSGRCALP